MEADLQEELGEAGRHVERLGAIMNDDGKAAYLYLLLSAERAGLRSSCNTGHVKAVRLHDSKNRYLFSWSANQAHLLFYLRRPALEAKDDLAASARNAFPRTNTNPGGEETITVSSLEEAKELWAWLLTQLPLP